MTARYDQMGPVTVPLSSVATGASLATLCDPAIPNLLAAFKSILRTKLDTAWNAAASSLSSHVVEGTYPYEPMPTFARRAWQWPALFMWRQKEKLFERTQHYDVAESTGKLAFILPPMPYEHAIRLEPIRVAVRTCLVEFIEQHGDPEWDSGASPLTTNELESFTFTEARYGMLEGADTMMLHPMLDLTWQMRERQSFVSDNYPDTLDVIVTTYEVKSETTSAGTDLVTSSTDTT